MAENKAERPNDPTTGESLEGGQTDQIGDMLTEFGAGPAPEKKDSQEDFLNGGNPGKEKKEKVKEPVSEEESDDEEIEDLEEDEEDFDFDDDGEEEEDGEEDEEEGEETPSEVAELKLELASMKKLLERLAGEKKEEPPVIPKVEIDPAEFVTEADMEAFDENPMEFLQKFAAKIYTKAREDSINDIPGLVETTSRRQQALASARSKFFQDFPDVGKLIKSNPRVGELVRATANDLQQEHPGWSMEKVFSATGKEVRTLLKLSKDAEETDAKARKRKGNQPSKPRGKRRSGGGKEDRSGLQQELDSMLDTIE